MAPSARTVVLPALALSLFLLLALHFGTPVPRAVAQEQPTKTFVYLVSAEGFNKTRTSSIAVNEGDLVQIELVYDDDELGDNPHTIVVRGYGIEATVSPKQRTATITFRATNLGSFRIVCGNEQCEGHDSLQGLTLEVKAAEKPVDVKPEEEKPIVQSKLEFSASFPNVIRRGYNLTLEAVLQDLEGRPLAGLPIAFYVNSTWGPVKVSSAYTNASGVAIAAYRPEQEGQFEFSAMFDGAKGFQSASSEPVIKTLPVLTSPPQPDSSLGLRGSVLALVAGVVASVWATYGYVLSRILRIATDRTAGSQGEKPIAHSEMRVPGGIGATELKETS